MVVFVQFVLVAAVVAPSFVLFALHLLVNWRRVNDKWKKNEEYRKRRKAGNNLRMSFNARGEVVKEEVAAVHQLECVERVILKLSKVIAGHAFGNSTLFKHHNSVRLAKEVAERCKQGVFNFLSLRSADPQLLSSVQPLEELLEELLERRELSSEPVAVLNAFKEQVAVLHAAFSGSRTASGSWTYAGDAAKGVKEALLGQDQAGKTVNSVPDFASNPIPELTKRATKLLKSASGKEKRASDKGRSPSRKDDDNDVPKPRFIEPLDMAEQVHIRAGGLLFLFVELRDKYSLGSNRTLMAIVVTVLAAGPVRFVGLMAAAVLGGMLLLEILVEVSRANERGDFGGFLKAVKGSMHRLVLPVFLGVAVLLAFNSGRLASPENVGEFEAKGTFLPLPPQYVAGLKNLIGGRRGTIPIEGSRPLASFLGAHFHVGVIYGVMHSNLWVLCLLPLPVCYALQAQFVERFPKFRRCVPQNPVWLHRTLGYFLIGGLLSSALFWLVVQGLGCFVGQLTEPQLCDAFEPQGAIFKDVFVLRFHLVWPLMFVFIPLMVYDKYPEDATAAPADAASKPSTAGASAPQDESREMLLKAGPGQPSSRSGGDVEGGQAAPAGPGPARAEEEVEKPTALQLVLNFVRRRLTEVCMVSVAGAGSVIAITGAGSSKFVPFPVPFWPLVLLVLVLQLATKFRDFLLSKVGPKFGCLGARADELTQLLRVSWWEVAYVCHTVGFLGILLFALYIRIQVFWVGLFSWGLYFYDRKIGISAAAKNAAQIVVSEGKSSYVVDRTERGVVKASYVRLVLKRPEGFKYRAGQWVHLALPHLGAHLGAPAWLSPLLHWHAFSIASAEHEDELEFHIAVNGSAQPIVDGEADVIVSGHSENFLRLSRRGQLLEWLRPHIVPLFGCAPGLPARGATFKANSSGVFVHLTGPDGQSLKVLQPQEQWTGRLWNTVQWLIQSSGSGGDTPQQMVRIMGPYGTLPYTCEAHNAVMLIGAGVGYPSTGSMLRKVLEENAGRSAEERKAVCFMWTATKVDQLLLCFPSLLVDLARYVKRRSLEDLKSWLTVKIFISSFNASDFLSVDPGKHLFPEAGEMEAPLRSVREWLLGKDGGGDGYDEDGTYIAQGSLGASFGDILRCSLFVKEHVIRKSNTLGICFCGPHDLCSWVKSEQANSMLPVRVEFHSECAG